MIKRILSFLFSLLLMASFYIYAVMREDEESKRAGQWLVAEESPVLEAMGSLAAIDPVALAQKMGSQIMLPRPLSQAQVKDAAYHGRYARLLEAQGGQIQVYAVRPLAAAPLIRPGGIAFTARGRALFGLPLLEGQDDQYTYFFASARDTAYVARLPHAAAQQADAALQWINPPGQ